MKPSHVLPFVSLASAICHHRTSLYTRSLDARAAADDGKVEVSKFGYDDLTGPLNWHGRNNESSKCAMGRHQSPINLNDTSAALVPGSSLRLDLPAMPGGAVFENLGSTLEVVVPEGTLTRHGRRYKIAQFHFHTPSEHRVEGEHFPMEVHFVFEAEANNNSTGPSHSVLGFLIEVDNSRVSPLLTSVFSRLDEVSEPGSRTETGPLDFCELGELLGRTPGGVYQYDGSLTTPPCDEGIAWNVAAGGTLAVDDATYRAAKRVMKFNARYTQNVPGRVNLLDHSRVILNAQAPPSSSLAR